MAISPALAAALAASTIAAAIAPAAASAQAVARVRSGTLPSGARWAAEMPAHWNGTLLLWSRGYSPAAGGAEAAPAQYRQVLLDAGYALVGSDYGAGGWALADAVPAQKQAIESFAAAFGKPRRVIGWGNSMGGLVTTALAEERRPAIDGAAPFCASIGGALGMMNMALDGAYAFRTLVAPDAGIGVVGIDDDQLNGKRVSEALAAAMKTPAGRARVALASVLAGLPGWTRRDKAEPAARDSEAQVEEMADAFVRGVFLPRVDQEKRAGGVFSWNDGIDYRAQLALSGRRALIEPLYRRAGISLDDDLARLHAGPRIKADRAAVDYMRRHYTPNGRPRVPLVTVQMVGDGLTSPSLQRGYVEASRGRDVKSLWLRSAGHCGFRPETVVATINYLDARLARGKWPAAPAAFVPYTPPPMLRPCVRGGRCR
jgi:hypothetical protein